MDDLIRSFNRKEKLPKALWNLWYLKYLKIGFNKGILSINDRTLYEPMFLKQLRTFFGENEQSVDFIIYLCDLMKTNCGLISFSLLKRKITSNLKNFKEIKANLSN